MNRRNNLFKKIGKVLTAYSIIFSTGYTIIAYLKTTIISPLIFAIIVISILILITFVKNGYIIELFFRLVNIFEKNPLRGIWNIEIKYTNEKGEKCYRTGNCEFVETVFGISIKGGNIYDKNSQSLEVDYWLADNVDIFTKNNGNHKSNFLIYHYNTYADNSNRFL